MNNTRFFHQLVIVALCLFMVSGCTLPSFTRSATTSDAVADAKDIALSTPSRIGNASALQDITSDELRRLNLVATNLVSVLLQIPELRPLSVTLQVARPDTAFGNVLVRALEDAGFALQLVGSDEGSHYVAYGRRFSETDSGPVTDFTVSINDIELQREFANRANGIFPTSLMSIRGTAYIEDIQVPDHLFKEQGGEANVDSFISGARSEDATSARIAQVNVNPYDRIPLDKQTSRATVIAQSKQFYLEADRLSPQLEKFDRHRRTVLMFEDTESLHLGAANKQSTRLLAREYQTGDLLVVRACNDMDGSNDKARTRAVRVEEEFIGHGVPQTSIYLAPCSRANYRHPSDNSPVPVEIVHYRLRSS